jgi:hypothetical protein
VPQSDTPNVTEKNTTTALQSAPAEVQSDAVPLFKAEQSEAPLVKISTTNHTVLQNDILKLYNLNSCADLDAERAKLMAEIKVEQNTLTEQAQLFEAVEHTEKKVKKSVSAEILQYLQLNLCADVIHDNAACAINQQITVDEMLEKVRLLSVPLIENAEWLQNYVNHVKRLCLQGLVQEFPNVPQKTVQSVCSFIQKFYFGCLFLYRNSICVSNSVLQNASLDRQRK